MSVRNYMDLKIPSKSQNEAFARVVVAAFASQLDPTIEELADVKTAVSEAVTNAIIHGYDNSEGIITIKCQLTEDGIEVEVSDSGKGIEDIAQARQPLYTSRPELERSGMGFTVMETFMDQLEVYSTKDQGTTVIMRKKFASLKTE
jgi:stage II sporulation protein AB (anti-sigma F factor)